MPIGYRTILWTDYTPESLDAILDVLRKWSSEKKGFITLPPAGEKTDNSRGGTLSAEESLDEGRSISSHRWTLSEEWEAPKWYKNSETSRLALTRITLVFDKERLWLWVDIESPTLRYTDSSGRDRIEPQPTGTPQFVSEMLAQLEMHDGLETPVSDVQQLVTESHLDHLLAVLTDSNRFGAAYVSSPPNGVSVDVWADRMAEIVGRIEGMGFSYVLDPDLRNSFNTKVSHGHSIPAGSLRTFLPGAEFGDTRDALRHRLLHSRTIEESSTARLRRILRNAQVDRLQKIDLPEALRTADYDLLRQRSLKTFQALHQEPQEPRTNSAPTENTSLLKSLSEAEELLTIALDDNNTLRGIEREMRSLVEESKLESESSYLEIATLREHRERDAREIDYLRRELSRLGDEGAAAAFGFIDTADTLDYPTTFAELLDNLSKLSGVKFFGNATDAKELDEYSDLGLPVVMRAWDALITFNAYVRARRDLRFSQSLSHYISHSEHGLPMRISSVTWSEGETVRNNKGKMKAQRTITGLPPEISPSGSKLLVAHVRLANGRGNYPRLYFDDTFDAAGFVTIGYIGVHPINTRTN